MRFFGETEPNWKSKINSSHPYTDVSAFKISSVWSSHTVLSLCLITQRLIVQFIFLICCLRRGASRIWEWGLSGSQGREAPHWVQGQSKTCYCPMHFPHLTASSCTFSTPPFTWLLSSTILPLASSTQFTPTTSCRDLAICFATHKITPLASGHTASYNKMLQWSNQLRTKMASGSPCLDQKTTDPGHTENANYASEYVCYGNISMHTW